MSGTISISLAEDPSTNKLDSAYFSGYDVYWLIGQSNIIGRASIRSGTDDVYSDITGRVLQFGFNAQSVIAAVNPLDHADENSGQMGLWLEFVKARLAVITTKRKILLVPAGQGGTSFAGNHWNPSNAVYNAALARLAAAMGQGSGANRLCGALWLQGESDADAGDAAATAYLSKLQTMYDAMVANASGMTTSTPFIVGSIKPDKPRANIINSSLQEFSTNNSAVEYVDLTDLAWFDSDHYTAASLASAGQRYASNFL